MHSSINDGPDGSCQFARSRGSSPPGHASGVPGLSVVHSPQTPGRSGPALGRPGGLAVRGLAAHPRIPRPGGRG